MCGNYSFSLIHDEEHLVLLESLFMFGNSVAPCLSGRRTYKSLFNLPGCNNCLIFH